MGEPIDTDDLRRMADASWHVGTDEALTAAADEMDALRARSNDADELWRHCEMLRRALKAACDDGWTDGEGAFDRYVRNAFVDVTGAAALSGAPAEPVAVKVSVGVPSPYTAEARIGRADGFPTTWEARGYHLDDTLPAGQGLPHSRIVEAVRRHHPGRREHHHRRARILGAT